jgi:hypothetical protein
MARMRQFFTAFAGGAIGKIVVAIALAYAIAIGFGPDWMAQKLIGWLSDPRSEHQNFQSNSYLSETLFVA